MFDPCTIVYLYLANFQNFQHYAAFTIATKSFTPYNKLVEIWGTESHFMVPLCNIDWRLFLTMISYLSLQKIFLQNTRHAHVLKSWQVIDSLLVKCQGNASSTTYISLTIYGTITETRICYPLTIHFSHIKKYYPFQK